MKKSVSLLAVAAVLLLAAQAAAAASGWKAGTASVKITPTEPIWMGGYASRSKPSQGVRQELFAKALALEDATGSVSVIVTADLLGFTHDMNEAIAARVKAKYGVSRHRLVLNASHTHSGPVTGAQLDRPRYKLMDESYKAVIRGYTAKLLDQVVELVGRALEERRPVELTFEQGLAGVAVNRRRVGHREYPGPTDHDVPVMAVRRPQGELVAVVFGYACHATVMNDYQIHGDWPGYAQAALEREHPGTVALFANGCGADQNPLPRRQVRLARRYGETVAMAVDLVLAGKMRPLAGPLKAVYETVDLPLQEPPSRQGFEKRLSQSSERERNHARLMIERLDRDGKLARHYPYPVQVWQFGDGLTFIALAGEVVVDYSLRFKREYGWEDTWVSGYNNDVFAYIPTLRVRKEGGYEGLTSMLGYGLPAPFSWAVEEIVSEKVGELVGRVGGRRE